jgi:hypothetical protein
MIRTSPRPTLVAMTALVACCALAACGSSSSSSSSTGSSASASTSTTGGTFNRTAFQNCLRQHGVTLPNRPAGAPPAGRGRGGGPGGGLFFGGGGGGAGGRFANPKFRAAIQACGGFRGGVRRFRITHTAITNFVNCARSHGFPQMPNPNFSGKGGVFPSSIRTNPKFMAAARACQSTLAPPPPSGTGTTATS